MGSRITVATVDSVSYAKSIGHHTLACFFQLLMADAATLLGVSYMVHSAVCGGSDRIFFAQLVSSFFFLCGLGTFLQATIGVRYARNLT